MKVGVSGDWHIDNSSGTYLLVDGISNREEDIKKQVIYIAKTCEKQDVKIFVVNGDLFSRTITTGYWIAFAIDLIEEFTKRGIEVIILPGNHDISENTRGLMPALQKLRNEKTDIIEKAQIRKFGKTNIFFAPHERKENYKNHKSYTHYLLNKIAGADIDCIIGHFQPIKAVPGSEESMFAGSTRFVDTTKFDSIPMLVNHVHKPQIIDEHVYLIGSPVRFNMGERKEQKEFVIYDTEKDVEHWQLDCQKMSKIAINLVRKNTYELSLEKIKKYKNHMVGIYIETTKENRPAISQIAIQALFQEVGAHIIQFKIKTISKDKTREKSKNTNMSPESVFRRVVEENVESELLRKNVLKIGLKVLDELKEELV